MTDTPAASAPPPRAPLFSPEEVERYARHLVLAEIGGPGQQKLKKARMLVVGAGGLGAPALMYLAAAGVGHLTVIDDDEVSLSNLQRQIIHTTAAIGRRKTESAGAFIAALNPHVAFEGITARLTAENALGLVGAADVVIDGSDNFSTRYLVSDACALAGRPLVSAALGRFDATVTTLRPHEKAPDGTPNPTYRCLFPEPPPAGLVPSCAEAGILGAVAGVAGTLVALEAARAVVGFGEGLVGRLLMIDTLTMRFETLSYGWDPDNPLTGENPTITDLSGHAR